MVVDIKHSSLVAEVRGHSCEEIISTAKKKSCWEGGVIKVVYIYSLPLLFRALQWIQFCRQKQVRHGEDEGGLLASEARTGFWSPCRPVRGDETELAGFPERFFFCFTRRSTFVSCFTVLLPPCTWFQWNVNIFNSTAVRWTEAFL